MNKTRLATRLAKSLKEFHNEHLNLQKQLRRAGLKLSTNETRLASSVAKQIAAEIDREILQDLENAL